MSTTILYKTVNDKVEVAIVGPDTIDNFLANGWTTDAPDMGDEDEEEESEDESEREEEEEEAEDAPDTKPITVPVAKRKKIKVRR